MPYRVSQAFYLISHFVDEVFAQPDHVCLCMRWGCHEVDSSHHLSCLVLNALELLLELLPSPEDVGCKHIRLPRVDLQRILLRSLALDTYLLDHLFIE